MPFPSLRLPLGRRRTIARRTSVVTCWTRKASPPLAAAAALVAVACSGSGPHATPLDASADAPVEPARLPPPPAGEGVQMKTDAFDVPAATELQACLFFKVSDLEQAAGMPGDQPISVHRVQIVQKPGSHHMNLFRVRTVKGLDPANGTVVNTNGNGPCFVSSNWSDWPLLANTQQAGDQDWSYPDGVANELAPDEWLMLQTHYVNASTQTTPGGGQVAVNLWTLPADQVTAQIGTLFATNQSIRICESNPTPTFSTGCQFNSPTPVTIIGANGHFHSRGKEFDMYVWDGKSTTPPDPSARFYQSLAWDDPPMLHSPELAQPVPPNGGVWYTCSFQWQPPPASIGCDGLNAFDQKKQQSAGTSLPPDCCYDFGGVVDQNEHCNAFVYYYPKQDNVNCQ